MKYIETKKEGALSCSECKRPFKEGVELKNYTLCSRCAKAAWETVIENTRIGGPVLSSNKGGRIKTGITFAVQNTAGKQAKN